MRLTISAPRVGIIAGHAHDAAVRTGALVEGGTFRSDTRTNYLCTYTFANLADYDAGRPSAYTRRTGNPLVEYSHWQAGVFVQDDWRTRKNLTLSGGLRYELQTQLPDRLNIAPRGGLTWSPFKNGKTTVRGGAGVFYDWLDAETFEQTLRVDGVQQHDLIVRNNITTGRDDNGDTVFTDRPAGVRRNSATSRGMWDVAARMSYAFGFGSAPLRPAVRLGRR